MTETATDYAVEAPDLTELEQLNLDVAAIAGWENIEEWNLNPKERKAKRSFTGANKKHPELGIFVPDYANDLNAIYSFLQKSLAAIEATFSLQFVGNVFYHGKPHIARSLDHTVYGETPAIALCKLLLEVAPIPKPVPLIQVLDDIQIIDDDGEIEPTVIEATFN
jgi:hypothetical protein